MAKTTKDAPASQRIFKSTTKKMHDLYKLVSAHFLKNVAWQKGAIDYVKTDHVHYFHTITSKGVVQTTSTHTGGHFHKMELVTPATDTSPAVYKCSPPVKEAHRRIDGVIQKILVPFNEDDQHTHEVEYLKSEVFQEQKPNAEALKFIAQIQAQMNPPSVPGIEG